MHRLRLTFLVSLAGPVLISIALEAWAPDPCADVSRGTEEVFSRDLEPRELPPRQGPQRWIGTAARFEFQDVPTGAGVLEVGVQGQRGEVAVALDGVVLGAVPAGQESVTFPLPNARMSTRSVELRPPSFVSGSGRVLGARLLRVCLHPARRSMPSLRLFGLLFLPAAVAALAARRVGLDLTGAAAISVGVSLFQGLTLWPAGLVRSPYAVTLAGETLLAVLFAALVAHLLARHDLVASRWAFTALLATALVQGALATSPMMIVSDAVFHAHKLDQVAAGDWFPTSVTQHAQPFRIPYGVSFYALLAPLSKLGVADSVTLVRAGAGLAGVGAAVALFALLLPSGAARAGFAVLLLQLLPGTFDVPHSYGNLSNGFGQAITVVFFAWWAGRAPGGFLVGGLLLALAGLSHLSSLIILVVLCPALMLVRGAAIRADRTRLLALALGLALLASYYLHFWELIASQLPRLLEGGGQGRGASRGTWDAARLQVLALLGLWGWPAVVLSWLGRPRSPQGLERDLTAWWIAGGALLLPAIVSPLEVRYLYALTLPVAAAAGLAWQRMEGGGVRLRALTLGLALAQLWIGIQAIYEAVWLRYRP